MILNCNSCEKRFVVPDKAITAAGRLVQCSSCGTKWKQFPISSEINKIDKSLEEKNKKISNITKSKKKSTKKTRKISLYSPAYLAKKHGIHLNEAKTNKFSTTSEKITFGFYNSLILFIVIIITLFKGLHFFQDFISQKLPFTEFYLDYFFESIKNIFEIWKNLIKSY